MLSAVNRRIGRSEGLMKARNSSLEDACWAARVSAHAVVIVAFNVRRSLKA